VRLPEIREPDKKAAHRANPGLFRGGELGDAPQFLFQELVKGRLDRRDPTSEAGDVLAPGEEAGPCSLDPLTADAAREKLEDCLRELIHAVSRHGHGTLKNRVGKRGLAKTVG
jgi:hypothetical protein